MFEIKKFLEEYFYFILFLCIFRMGSFTSSIKIDNEDSQDKDLDFQPKISVQQLLDYCEKHNDQCQTSLIPRTFSAVPYGQLNTNKN